MPETIFLTKKKTGIAAYREKKGVLPFLTRVITSPKTTLALGATLATLLTAGAAAPAATGAALRATPAVLGRTALKTTKATAKFTLGSPKKVLATTTAIGILGASPKIRKAVVERIKDPFGHGRVIGEIIEDPSKAADILGIKDKEKAGFVDYLKTGAKAAGLAGVAIGGAAGAAALYKKYKVSKEEKKLQDVSQLKGLKTLGFTEPRPVGLGGVPVSVAGVPQIQPVGAPQATQGARPIQNIIQIAVR